MIEASKQYPDVLGDVTTLLRQLGDRMFTVRPPTSDCERSGEDVPMFIADACHELKTPLTIVMGYLDALGSGLVADPQEAHRIVERTRSECLRMRNTINRLAALVRLDGIPENIGSFDAGALASEVVESMKGLSSNLHLDVARDDETLVYGNRDELREAVVIAIDNALKYAPGSPVHVRVRTFSRDVTIEIADAGPGMSRHDVEHAFKRFHRGSSHSGVEGSGLGLSIAKRAVQRARGRIELLSEPRRGTTVRISLPRVAS